MSTKHLHRQKEESLARLIDLRLRREQASSLQEMGELSREIEEETRRFAFLLAAAEKRALLGPDGRAR